MRSKELQTVLAAIRTEAGPIQYDRSAVDRGTATIRSALRTRRRASWLTYNCGGPGSGRPGPCPEPDNVHQIGNGDRKKFKIDVPDPEGENAFDVTVRKNPSREELDAVVRTYANRGRVVKGLIYEGDLYIWNPGEEEVHHIPMANALGIKGKIPWEHRLQLQWDESTNRVAVDESRSGGSELVRKWVERNGLVFNNNFSALNAKRPPSPRKNEWRVTIQRLAPYLTELMPDLTRAQSRGIARSIKRGLEFEMQDEEVARLIEAYDIEPERARTIARTEMARAREDGKIGRLKPGQRLRYKLADGACPKCVKVARRLKGRRLTAYQAKGIIPVHVNCLCIWETVSAKTGRKITTNESADEPVRGDVLEFARMTENVFCATGEGGGVDPSCGKSSDRSESQAYTSADVLKDKKGKPIAAFHGSDNIFGDFKDGVIYFSPNPGYSYVWNGPNVYEAELMMKNPYRTENLTDVEGAAYQSDWVQELKNKGYDGIIYSKSDNLLKGPSGWGDDRPQYVVFSKEQIKLKKRYSNEEFQIGVQLGDIAVNGSVASNLPSGEK